VRQERRGEPVKDRGDLGRVTVLALSDEAILVHALLLPIVLRGHGPKRAENVHMMRHIVLDGDGGDEHLVSPEHRETTRATASIGTGLFDDSLEDCHRHKLATGLDGGRELHAWLVVVLCTREWCETCSLTSSVIETDADGAIFKRLVDVEAIALIR
jgi:hypothetical protein